MKRRSRAGGKASKARSREALKTKRRDASTTVPSSAPIGDAEVARLARELNEALEQQTATSEVLQVVSSFPGDLQPVFDKMLEKAAGICDAKFGNIYRWDGELLHLAATHKTPPAFADARRRTPLRPDPKLPLGRVIATKALVHVTDAAAEEAYTELRHPAFVAVVELGGVRTFLFVPMLKENELIGVFTLYRQEVRPFTDKQIALVTHFAAQAVIAIENARLLNELRQRTTDLTERTADLTEALEQQTATTEVLQVISSSPGDLEPVFAAMLENAARICDANFGNIFRWDGDALHLIATHNTPPSFAEYRKRQPLPLKPNLPFARMVAAKAVVHCSDAAALPAYVEQHDPEVAAAVELGGIRTFVAVPMLKENNLIGALIVYRQEVRPFTNKQIELVKNFAAQAVIAIENARLLNELRQRTDDLSQRTTDLSEALEQQTATSEVLQVISSSPGDLKPVFQAMLENATRICEAKFGVVFSFDGKEFQVEAHVGTPPKFAEYMERTRPIKPLPNSLLDRVKQTKRVSYTADYAAEGIPTPPVTLGGARSTIDVPMLKDGELVGAFSIFRQEVRPFTEKQIALLTNFAAQAVIAIENARLLNELRGALERQTATSEVLQVISSSPGDLTPVFAAMLEKAVCICGAKFGNIYRAEGDGLRNVVTYNTPTAFAEALRGSPYFSPAPNNPVRRMMTTKKIVHVLDVAATEAYAQREPIAVASVELGKTGTLMIVPMLKDNELVGAFTLARQEVRPFSDKQIDLVANFAAQAVIAVENARLLNELRQSLEQQTATAQVLQVISRSTGELAQVFSAILENATRICEAKFGTLYLKEDDGYRATATHNAPPAYEEARAHLVRPSPHTTLWQAANTKRPVQIVDVTVEQGYSEGDPFVLSAVKLGGYRSVLSVPLLYEDELVGVISIFRQEISSFSDEHVSLLQNFAAQAVIAIENARLLTDLQVRTQELSALNEQLEQRVADQVGEIERMSRLRRFLPPQVADLIVASGSEKQLESHRREITALFCDLRGFTGFTESADAEDVMALLRDYHAAIGEIIIKYNGTLERYAGDGVMVIFNDPVPVENPALQAVLMALEVRDAIGALTATWSRLGHEIGFGIGIAHGFATLGTIGFEGRFDYAAIGTVSNVASRLCDEAKPGQILISPRVLMKVENAVKVEPVGEFDLKGIRRPLAAYNVLAAVAARV